MSIPTAEEIIAFLPKAPAEGMTSLEVISHFKAASHAASKLSKLAAYGRIEKYKPPHSKTRWRLPVSDHSQGDRRE